jgi:dienelactone hydrolase
MQKFKSLSFLCLFLIFFVVGVQAQQVFKTTSPSVIGYLEYLPQDYHSNSNKYPVMIFLHGIGERGPNTTDVTTLSTSINEVAKLGPPMYVKNGTQFPFILISPQLKDNYGTWPSSYVVEVINHVKKYLRIDEKRIYLTGLSLGGGGVWVAAQDYPELFAAIAPVCGGYNSPSKACNLASENLPVWAFHGDADTVVPLSRSVNMVNAINACTPAPNPLAKMTIYPNVGHSAWTKAYKTDNSIHNPNLYQWITSYYNTANSGNKIPTANAGADQSVAATSLILNGIGTDSDGSIASYSWTKVSGPNDPTLTNLLTKSLTLTNLIIGTYEFRFTVTDNSGNTDSDYVKVVVSASNTLPVVSAGSDKSLTLPTNSISLTATANDADGTISNVVWSKISGSIATLSGTTTNTLSVSALTQGTYVFRFTATDNKGGSKYDDVTVNVKAASTTNALPVVNAGTDKFLTLPTKAMTLVSSSYDSDGTIVSYQWTKVAGGASSLSNTTTPKLFAYNLAEGVYTFRLTVTDNSGGVAFDEVNLTVSASSTATQTTTNNIAPRANAGLDKTLYYPSKSLTVVGSGTDADGTIVSYLWTKVSGPALSMSNATTPKLWATNLLLGTYVFRLKVTDNLGAIAYDDVKVIVSDGTTSITAVDDATLVSNEDTQQNVLANLNSTQLENATVVIYNDSGEKLYTGNWSASSHAEVMNKQGLYVYNVFKEGKRTDAGKIYVR